MKNKRGTQMWAADEFHQMLKAEAAMNGVSLQEWTRQLAKRKKENTQSNENNFPWIFKER